MLKRFGSVGVVHIAAHGSLETGEIALAPENGETDFILTKKDVNRVKIRATLVVLSCYHSAHGKIKAEGVVGIARAFLGAGARSILVSLWAIDDQATLAFVNNFYHHLVRGKSASEALNQAMKYVRECVEFSAVKYWAPFVFVGDDVTFELSGCVAHIINFVIHYANKVTGLYLPFWRSVFLGMPIAVFASLYLQKSSMRVI